MMFTFFVNFVEGDIILVNQEKKKSYATKSSFHFED